MLSRHGSDGGRGSADASFVAAHAIAHRNHKFPIERRAYRPAREEDGGEAANVDLEESAADGPSPEGQAARLRHTRAVARLVGAQANRLKHLAEGGELYRIAYLLNEVDREAAIALDPEEDA